MDYPTREQAEKIVYCLNGDCETCSVREWCEGEETTSCGKAMIAMHEAIDAKQAELDGRTEALDWTADRCDELALEAGLTKIELDKAHNFIKRINDKLKTWCGLIPWANEFITEANKILGVD